MYSEPCVALARHDQAKRTEKGVGSQIVGEKPVTSGRHKISYRHRLRLRIHHRDRYPVATVAAETAQSLKPLHIGHLQVERCRAIYDLAISQGSVEASRYAEGVLAALIEAQEVELALEINQA